MTIRGVVQIGEKLQLFEFKRKNTSLSMRENLMHKRSSNSWQEDDI